MRAQARNNAGRWLARPSIGAQCLKTAWSGERLPKNRHVMSKAMMDGCRCFEEVQRHPGRVSYHPNTSLPFIIVQCPG
jgi:hypothetical protein